MMTLLITVPPAEVPAMSRSIAALLLEKTYIARGFPRLRMDVSTSSSDR